MIKKAAFIHAKALSKHAPLFSFSTHHQPTPEKLNKVTATTVKFNVKNVEGQWEQIHGYEGESIFDAIQRMKVTGFSYPDMCDGNDFTYRPHERPHDPFTDGPSCGSCRIVFKDNWYEKVQEETDGTIRIEQALLLQFSDIRKNVRLSCCIPVEKWMDGCTFEILPDPTPSEIRKLF